MLSLTDTRVKYHDPRKLSPSEEMVEVSAPTGRAVFIMPSPADFQDNDVFEITDFTTASDWER